MTFFGHMLMKSRSGLVMSAVVTDSADLGKRAAALAMLDVLPAGLPTRITSHRLHQAARRSEIQKHF